MNSLCECMTSCVKYVTNTTSYNLQGVSCSPYSSRYCGQRELYFFITPAISLPNVFYLQRKRGNFVTLLVQSPAMTQLFSEVYSD